jgi:hypothetical protein
MAEVDDLLVICTEAVPLPLILQQQGDTRICRLSLLTNSALVYRVQMRGEGGDCRASANEYSCAHQVTWSPNKLWRSTSIFNLCTAASEALALLNYGVVSAAQMLQ